MRISRKLALLFVLVGCGRTISSPRVDGEVPSDASAKPDRQFPADHVSEADAGDFHVMNRLSAGLSHVCVVRSGHVNCAGGIVAGVLGYDAQGRSRDVRVPDEIVSLSSAQNSACALSRSGEVYCWGERSLGLGAEVSRVSEPTIATLSGVSFLSGSFGQCALRSEGAFCWGELPTLGSTTRTDRPQRLDLDGPVLAVSAGARFYCVLGVDHSIRCRGANEHAQSGRVPSTEVSSFVEIQGFQDGVKVRSGGSSSCALRAAGRVACWGSNQFGTLGNGRGEDQFIPADVRGLDGVRQFDMNGVNVCALTQDETVWCWGTRQTGLMGDGVRVDDAHSANFVQATPVRIPGLTEVVDVAVGTYLACALRRDQSVWCWGWNDRVSLPWPNNTVSRPVRVIEGF